MKKTFAIVTLETVSAVEVSAAAAVACVAAYGRTYHAAAVVAYGLYAAASAAAESAKAALAAYLSGKKTKAAKAAVTDAVAVAVNAESTLAAYVAEKHTFAEVSETCRAKAAAAVAKYRNKADFGWKQADGAAAAVVAEYAAAAKADAVPVAELKAAKAEKADAVPVTLETWRELEKAVAVAKAAALDTMRDEKAHAKAESVNMDCHIEIFAAELNTDGAKRQQGKKIDFGCMRRDLAARVAEYMESRAASAAVKAAFADAEKAAKAALSAANTSGVDSWIEAAESAVAAVADAKKAALAETRFNLSSIDSDIYKVYLKKGAKSAVVSFLIAYGGYNVTDVKQADAIANDLRGKIEGKDTDAAKSNMTVFTAKRRKVDFCRTLYAILSECMLSANVMRRVELSDACMKFYKTGKFANVESN